MSKQITIEFKKGDSRTHYFKLPIASYTAGGKLFFAAKLAADNDNTDAAAVINKTFTDANVTLDGTYATWTMNFLPTDITVTFGAGTTKNKYKGEFQYVESNGRITTFPSNDGYIEVVVYADIKRGTA